MPDVTVSTGLYTRRPSINGCYPWPRPATGQTFTFLGIVESIDPKVPNFIPNTAVNTAGGAVGYQHAAGIHGAPPSNT